ncbi:MAG: hypothetical protein KAH23_03645 [Kiritimatiellae bacterium]|nr:hypothetical protein [Kiritimatiellia bacterium]
MGATVPKPSNEDVILAFEKMIHGQEDLMYGVALFFECISLLHAGQSALIETYRRQFRNIIQTGTDAAHHAMTLLEQVKHDPSQMLQLKRVRFSPCQGHPEPEKMQQRAMILLETYAKVFPERSKSDPFTREETLKLIESSSERLGSLLS